MIQNISDFVLKNVYPQIAVSQKKDKHKEIILIWLKTGNEEALCVRVYLSTLHTKITKIIVNADLSETMQSGRI